MKKMIRLRFLIKIFLFLSSSMVNCYNVHFHLFSKKTNDIVTVNSVDIKNLRYLVKGKFSSPTNCILLKRNQKCACLDEVVFIIHGFTDETRVGTSQSPGWMLKMKDAFLEENVTKFLILAINSFKKFLARKSGYSCRLERRS